MDRPALKKLLDDVRARRVDVIVVYKVDRLTRSLADFAKLVVARRHVGDPQHQRLRDRATGGVRNSTGRGGSLGRQQTISALEPRVPFWNLSGRALQHELIRARDGAAVSLAVRNDIEAAYRVLASLLGAGIAQVCEPNSDRSPAFGT